MLEKPVAKSTGGVVRAKNSLSLIVPTFNEKENITRFIEKAGKALAGYDFEILIIDDDSPDGTADAARSLSGQIPVRVIVRKGKKGLASAVVDGIGYASGEFIGVMDADLQHPPDVLNDLFKALDEGAEVAVASRYVKGGGCEGWSLTRKIISRGAILLAHLFLPETRNVSDPMAGYFMFRRNVADGVELKPTGYKILLELLVRGKYRKLVEVPYMFQVRQEGKSKLGMKTQVDYLRHLFSLMRAREIKRIFKFFLVGGSGVLVNMGLLWLLTEFIGFYYLFSAAISIEVSIITNFTLNNVFTFRDRRSRTTKGFFEHLLKFNLVSLAGLGINLAVLWFFTSVVGIYYLISNLFGIAAATAWNYIANSLWTWR